MNLKNSVKAGFSFKNLFLLVFSVLICLSAGFIGSVFTAPSIPTWYASLNKPFFSPPNWLFAPVWTLLYVLMGISLFLVLSRGIRKNEFPLSVFSVQLFLNALWSFLFFGLRSPPFAFLEIIVLWLAIAATIFLFHRISKTAALLLLPYIAWVSFAAFLNFYVMLLNP